MSGIASSPTSSPTQIQSSTANTTQTPTPATLARVSKAFATLPKGVAVEGIVEGRNPNGTLSVRTSLGSVNLNTQAVFPSGTSLILRVTNPGTQTGFTLFPAGGLNNAKPEMSGTEQTRNMDPLFNKTGSTKAIVHSTINTSGTNQTTQTNLALGQLLTGSINRISNAAGSSNTSPTPAPLASGSSTIEGVVVSNVNRIQAPGYANAANMLSNHGTTVSTPISNVTVTGVPNLESQIQPITMKLLSLQSPGSLASGNAAYNAASTASTASYLSALVTGSTTKGQPILQTAIGTITLDVSANLPLGTRLALDIQTQTPSVKTAPYGSLQAVTELQNAYKDLRQLVGFLAQAEPASAQALINVLPQVGGQFAAGLLFFISALRLGDGRSWLSGDIGNAAERIGREGNLRRFSNRMSGLKNATVEQRSGEWRAMPIPIVQLNGQIEQISLYARDQWTEDETNTPHKQGTRFVVEFALSRFGAMQLDGLFMGNKRRFDLMIRAQQELTKEVRQHITELFTTATMIHGFAGAARFEIMQKFPIAPSDDMARTAATASTNSNLE